MDRNSKVQYCRTVDFLWQGSSLCETEFDSHGMVWSTLSLLDSCAAVSLTLAVISLAKKAHGRVSIRRALCVLAGAVRGTAWREKLPEYYHSRCANGRLGYCNRGLITAERGDEWIKYCIRVMIEGTIWGAQK
jgi:hypothetical protein